MTQQDIINRVRISILRDTGTPKLVSDDELCSFLGDIVDELTGEMRILIDSETTEICQRLFGIDGSKIAIGTPATTINITTAISFLAHSGSVVTIPVGNLLTLNTLPTQPINTICVYVIISDYLGALSIIQGNFLTPGSFTDNILDQAPQIPTFVASPTSNDPAYRYPIAAFSITTDSTHTFTFGTTALNGIGITCILLTSSDLVYPYLLDIDPRVTLIMKAQIRGARRELWVTSVSGIEGRYYYSGWWGDFFISNPPANIYWPSSLVVEGLDTQKMALHPRPNSPGTLRLTVSRRLLVEINDSTNADNELELPSKYHRKLFNAIAAKAYGKNDSEVYNPEKANYHQALWEADREKIEQELIRLEGNVFTAFTGIM